MPGLELGGMTGCVWRSECVVECVCVVQCAYECRHGGVDECVRVLQCRHRQRLGCRLALVGHLGPTTMEA